LAATPHWVKYDGVGVGMWEGDGGTALTVATIEATADALAGM
jgi:hypothetical protein